MKKIYLYSLFFASLGLVSETFAENHPKSEVSIEEKSVFSAFTPEQLEEMDKFIASYLSKHPDVVLTAVQAGMELKQKEDIANMEKAVSKNKDKIFNDPTDFIAGNSKGTQSLVVFIDPYCGYCKKFHEELNTLLSTNKNIKVIFKYLPIMGKNSEVAIKAMLAAKNQGKYDKLQKVVFESENSLTQQQLLKIAASIGINVRKLKTDMKSKTVKSYLDNTLELSKIIEINGTPALIIGETKVVPGYVSSEELAKMLKEIYAPNASLKDEKQKS